MKKQRMTIDPFLAPSNALGRIDTLRGDATTEEKIAHQQAKDEAEAMQDAAHALLKIIDKAPETALAALE